MSTYQNLGNIVINSTHADKFLKNSFTYKFPVEQFYDDTYEIGISKANVYNCIYNISTEYNNNTFTIKWIDGVEKTFTIRDGYYSISDLNQYINECLISENWYTLSSPTASTTTTYIYLNADLTGYKSFFVISPLPSQSTVSGSTIEPPTGANWSFPNVDNQSPTITLSAGLGERLGFTNSNLTITNLTNISQTIFSDQVPEISVVNTYVICCSLINNSNFSNAPESFFSMSLGSTSFGNQVSTDYGGNILYYNIKNGRYNQFRIYILDQNLNQINLIDKEVLFQLTIRKKII